MPFCHFPALLQQHRMVLYVSVIIATFVKMDVGIMNTRLQQFLGAENISQSQFADELGVARASVSHIIAGRNKPGFDFLTSLMARYPRLNMEWLLAGKGKMYKDNSASDVQTSYPTEDSLFQSKVEIEEEPSIFPQNPAPTQPQTTILDAPEAPISSPSRRITKIIVFYDDNSYQELI